MAQTNFTPILTYKSDTATAVPSAGNLTNSANGAELAVNTADKRLFTKDSGGNVVELGTNPSSVTLPNGTANGVVYANGSKVLTTGSALTFDGTNLGVLSAGLNVGDGTTTLRSVAAGGVGLFGTSTDHPLAFRTNNTEQMRLTSTGLGIGTSSPTEKLTVFGNAVVSGSTGYLSIERNLIPTGAGSGTPSLQFRMVTTGTTYTAGSAIGMLSDGAWSSTSAPGILRFFTTPSGSTALVERMRINSAGNVGIGTTLADGTLVLSAGTSGTISAGGYLGLTTGTNASKNRGAGIEAYSLTTGNDHGLRFYTNASTTAPAERLRIDSTGNLYLGGTSGTVNPALNRFISVQSQTNNDVVGYALYANEGVNNRRGSMFLDDANGTFGWDVTASSDVPAYVWRFVGTERMRITNAGNVGIGTSSPSGKLDVTGSVGTVRVETTGNKISFTRNGANYISAAGGSSASISYDAPVHYFNSGDGATTRMTLNDSGNLGLGVTPSAWDGGYKAFQISAAGHSLAASTAGAGNLALSFNAFFDSTDSRWEYVYTGDPATQYSTSSGQHRWYTAPSGTAGDAISFSQVMTLTAAGDLLVGTTSALYGGERVAVNGASGAIGQAIYANGASSIGLLMYSSIATGATAGKQISFVRNDGVEVGSITSNGSTTLYNTTSDQRLKENIQDAAPASSLIDALQVRQYDWKSDGSHQRYGFIAQELVTVAPEAVHQPADPEEMMAVDYSKLVPMLVKEIQSLRARLAAANI